MDLDERTWGTSSEGSTMMITGTYQMEGEVSRRLLDALPSLLGPREHRAGVPA
jgi:hypothetical protein